MMTVTMTTEHMGETETMELEDDAVKSALVRGDGPG
jgi:hypothetical protein